MILWDISPSSSPSARFPNKFTIPCPSTLSLNLLAYYEGSSMSLDSVMLLLLLSLQLCPTLCDPIDSSLPGSPVPRIPHTRTLEWVAISFSNAWKWKVNVKSLSRVRLCATPWTAAYRAPPSMGFSRQEYWSGVPLPSPSVMLCMTHGLRFETPAPSVNC